MRSSPPHAVPWRWLLLACLLLPGLLGAQEPRTIRVEVVGVEGELHDTLHNDLSLSHLEDDRYPAQTEFLFRRGERELLNSLRAHGYYQAEVSSALQRNDLQTVARFVVSPGEPVVIRAITIQILGEGVNERAWREYRQFDMPLKVDQPLHHADYETTVRDLMNIALNHGYLDARYQHKSFQVSPERGMAEVLIELDTGEPYLFGEVFLDENTGMDRDFLRRFIEFEPGEHYSNARLAELQQHYINSRYFSLVRYEPRFYEQQDREIPIYFQFEDNLPHRYRLGAGAGTDTGARVLFGFENRLVNRRGHRYEFDGMFGQYAQSYLFNYSIPGRLPARQKWNLRTGWEATQSDFLERSRTTLMPEYSHLTRNNWLLAPYLSLERERFQYTDQEEETVQLLVAGIGVQKRVLNNTAYPARGYRHNLALRGSQHNFISDTEFVQLELATKGVISPLDRWRLIGRIKVATTKSKELEDLPATYRYLLGGETLRGFAFESVGLTDEAGNLTGAEHMALASIETDYRFTRWFGLAAFTDAGQVYDRHYDSELKVGSGIGVRGFTPVGVVRLDLAWAISEDDRPKRFHLSLGLDL